MQTSYALQYRTLSDTHWWWRARERLVYNEIESLFPGATDLKILDIGCGDGFFWPKLARFGTVEGVEPDEKLVTAKGRCLGQIHLVPFETFETKKQFDLILILDVLEHSDQPEFFLKKAIEMLSPQGRILITVPAFPKLWTRLDELNHHHQRFTKKTFKALAKKANFQILSLRYRFHWVVPTKIITKSLEKISQKPVGIGVPPRLINWLLFWLTCLEAKLAPTGSLPGTSIVIVGSRI